MALKFSLFARCLSLPSLPTKMTVISAGSCAWLG